MKTGIIFGAFDLLHPGHLHVLKESSKRCDWLIVGLQVDPSDERKSKNKPVETIFERYYRLDSCAFVDQIIPYEGNRDLVNMLHVISPDVRFLGDDYEGHEEEIVGCGIVEIEYLPRKHDYSSTNLRKKL